MRPNLTCIITLCLLSLILSCGDDQDEPSIDIVKASTESPKDESGVPDADNLAQMDPLVETDQDLDLGEEIDPPEAEVVEPAMNPRQVAIVEVLERMRDGYEKEDLDLYLSAFWIDGFHYTSDMATPEDRFDDLIIDELKREAQSTARVFKNFQNIGLEIFTPAEITNAAPERIDAMAHYRIQAFVNDGHALEGGFLAWYAEGDARFTFEFREEEWRITTWFDDAFNAQAIEVFNKGIKLEAAVNPIDKLVFYMGRDKKSILEERRRESSHGVFNRSSHFHLIPLERERADSVCIQTTRQR